MSNTAVVALPPGIYKNRYTSGESIIKIGALHHNYRYIFVINIGTNTNICYKNRYATQKCDKNRYTCHENRYIFDMLLFI
jgi:hypothetical protein